jgi:hypothetical protein
MADSRYPNGLGIDEMGEILSCHYCGNYSEPLKDNPRGQVVCKSFEDCVWNRVENGLMTEARAKQLLERKVK